jgi:putative alpha-1,2-mannosidase
MSAWYLFSALGLYPFAPGSANYALTAPLVKEATIQLDGQHILQIVTENNSDQNVYIQSAYWNGKRLSKPFISHLDLMQGGELHFVMGPKPSKKAFNVPKTN